MPSFQKLVDERQNSAPSEFFANGSKPSASNPFSPEYAASTIVANTDADHARSAPQTASQPKQSSKSAAYNGTQQAKPISAKFAKERAETAALKEKVDIIQLNVVMAMLGALPNQDKDKSKWKIVGIGNIGVTGQKWYNMEEGKGGHGAVSLVQHAMGLKYHEAVKWLAVSFGEQVDSDDIKASIESMAVKAKKAFSPPVKEDKYISFVKHYLHFTRKLPEDLIETMIKQGRIYADSAKNCVFASEGIAELRSSFDGPNSVKQLVPGSSRKKGFIVLPDPAVNEKTIAICEGSIDALSYRAMNPGRAAISAAGVNPTFPRSLAEEAIEGGLKVIAAFDADRAGDKASQALFNHFYIKLWIKHKAQSELSKVIEDEDLFNLLNSNTVSFRLGQAAKQGPTQSIDDFENYDEEDASPAPDEPKGPNILFFNSQNPFEDPASPPTILLSIKRNEFGLPQCSDHPIEVSQKGYDFIVNKLGITRDRPKGEKDWNEVLKKQTVEQTKAPNQSGHKYS